MAESEVQPTRPDKLSVLDDPENDGVVLTEEEAWDLFDLTARRNLGISGKEFLRRFKAGEYDDAPDEPKLIEVMFARYLVAQETP